jgi:hypothetical protein
MLLPKEPDPFQYLASTRPRGLEPLPKVRVLTLESLQALRGDPRRPSGSIDRLYPCLSLQRTPPEPRQLVAEVTHELLKLGECLVVRSFAV